MRILLVDDDEPLMETLAENLIRQRYAVDLAIDGETAHEFLALFSYDLIVLDMLLPDIDGISLCQQVRQHGFNSPILMLTARDSSMDKVHALDAGADDYVVKPFDFDELCARIRALLRRDSQAPDSVLTWGDLSLHPDTFEVFYGTQKLRTTPKEYAMLELFLRHTNRVFSLDAIIENLWSFDDPPSGDAVRTHIKGLRQKLKAGGAPKDFIETVYGLGYRLKPPTSSTPPDLTDSESKSLKKSSQPKIAAAVSKMWETHQDTMQERLSVLEATAAALDVGKLGSKLQHEGRSHAHKLAGSLGCFGFWEGSRLARELEHLLQLEVPLSNQHASKVSTLVQNLRQNLNHDPSHTVISEAIASGPQLLAIGADESLNPILASDALTVGMQCSACSDVAQAHAMLQTNPPNEILLWLDESKMPDTMKLLEAIAQHSDPIPTLVITDIQDFQQRLQLVQHGVDHILPASAMPQHIIRAAQQALQTARAAIKIVIVDDDPQILDFLKTVLSPWGLQLTTVDNPDHLWNTLETVHPDLLILDVEMPQANGLDLCQVLRADERWQQLSILFLTVHEDTHTKQQAFTVGADDFVSKSAIATELPTRIFNRLRRSQPSAL
ncbi:MAG: response regulator [Cyanobacteria bacterium P01_A01_bin.37]